MEKISLLLLLLCFIICPVSAQNDKHQNAIKSHRNLRNAKSAIEKVNAIIELGEFHYSISNQRIYPKSIDSVSYYADQLAIVSKSINFKKGIGESYILHSKAYYGKGELNNAIQYSQQAIDLFSKLQDKNDLARSYTTLALVRGTQGDIDVTLSTAEKAYTLYKETGNILEQANVLVEIAYLKMGVGKMEAAIVDLKSSLKLYSESNHPKIQRAYSLLGVAHTQMGSYKEGLENSLNAVRLVEKYNDTSLLAAEIYNYVALTYNQLRDIEKSNEYLQKAYKISNRYDVSELNSMILINIIQTFRQLKKNKQAVDYLKEMEKDIDKMDESSRIMLMSRALSIYTEMSDFKAAEKYYNEAIAKVGIKESSFNWSEILYSPIIKYLIKTEQYDKARIYVAEYKKLSEKSKDKKKLQEVHGMLFHLDSIESKFVSALHEYRLQEAYKDSLFRQEKNKQISELQIKFETEKKDKDILLKEQQNSLLRKQGELQESKLSKANLMKNIGFGSMFLFLIIIILLFLGYRRKQRMNRILESKQVEINQQNSILQKLLVDKEWLLKEIHHRVKNNLHMVISLLNVQSYHLKDPAAMDALRESQNRIQSMSLIHKKLYQSESLMSIDMRVYILELVEYFQSTFDMGQSIQFSLDLDPIELDTAQAVPLGLILNEAITNSIKHAFIDKEKGLISLSFKQLDEHCLRMIISDNGVGIPRDFDKLDFKSLGMKLIKGFCSDINAKLSIKNEKGLVIIIEFLHYQETTKALLN